MTWEWDPNEDLPRNVVHSDRWDREDWDQALNEMPRLKRAADELTEYTPTGQALMEDIFFTFLKAAPRMREAHEIRPDHVPNRSIVEQARQLPETEELRRFTRANPVAAGDACLAIHRDLASLADRQAKERELGRRIQDMLAQLAAQQQEQHDIEEMIDRWSAEDEAPDGETEDSLREKLGAAMASIEQLQSELAAAADELEGQLGEDEPTLQALLAKAIGEAAAAAQRLMIMASTWGLAKGEWSRTPADERIKLARRIDTPRLREIIEKLGRIRPMAMTEQLKATDTARDILAGVTVGDDLAHIVPSELVKLAHPGLRPEFYRAYAEKQLMQYDYEGEERIGKGAIHLIKDGSGSMNGERDFWATAVMLVLLNIAKVQKREFHYTIFGGTGQLRSISFTEPSDFSPQRILDAAELSLAGAGTHFETPLTYAQGVLAEEHDRTGRVEGDIMFVTDGEGGVSDEWLKWYHAESDRLKFTTYGVLIGHSKMSKDAQILSSICRKAIATVKDLMGGGDVKEIFRV